MARPGDAEDLKIVVRVLRSIRGWNQTALAQASGIDKSLISRYEAGKQAPSRRNLERIATAVGTPLALVEPMIPVVRRIRDAVEGRLPPPPEEAQDAVEAALQAVAEVIRGPLERAVAELRRVAGEGVSPLDEDLRRR